MNDNNWNEYSQLVLSELKRINTNIEKLEENLRKNQTDIAVLKAKIAIYSWASAFIMSIVSSIIVYYITK